MRPKARGLAQQGGSPSWLKESDQTQAGVILYAYTVFPLKIYCLKESSKGVGTRTKLI
jgi:hypothetical protein